MRDVDSSFLVDLKEDYRGLTLAWNELDKQHAKLQKHSRNQRRALRVLNRRASNMKKATAVSDYVAARARARIAEDYTSCLLERLNPDTRWRVMFFTLLLATFLVAITVQAATAGM